MAEYIEKEKLFDCLDIKNALGGYYGISLTAINAIPAADVVEVVRCSDCEYYDRNDVARLDKGCYFCSYFGGYTRPTFYCADGERKGGDE